MWGIPHTPLEKSQPPKPRSRDRIGQKGPSIGSHVGHPPTAFGLTPPSQVWPSTLKSCRKAPVKPPLSSEKLSLSFSLSLFTLTSLVYLVQPPPTTTTQERDDGVGRDCAFMAPLEKKHMMMGATGLWKVFVSSTAPAPTFFYYHCTHQLQATTSWLLLHKSFFQFQPPFHHSNHYYKNQVLFLQNPIIFTIYTVTCTEAPIWATQHFHSKGMITKSRAIYLYIWRTLPTFWIEKGHY